MIYKDLRLCDITDYICGYMELELDRAVTCSHDSLCCGPCNLVVYNFYHMDFKTTPVPKNSPFYGC